jgi:membrane protein
VTGHPGPVPRRFPMLGRRLTGPRTAPPASTASIAAVPAVPPVPAPDGDGAGPGPNGIGLDGTGRDGTSPDGAAPHVAGPDSTHPDGATPDGSHAGSTHPDGIGLDGTGRDGTHPDGTHPDGIGLDGTGRDGTSPDGAAPNVAGPDSTHPDVATLDGASPDGAALHSTHPDGARADGAGPGGARFDGAGDVGGTAGSGRTAGEADGAEPATPRRARVETAGTAGTPALPNTVMTGRRRLVMATLKRAWNDRVLGLSAEAAFWSLLSLPPLFLALLGSLGYFSNELGPARISDIEQHLLAAFSRAFSPTVVDQTIAPTISDLLRRGRADVISIGFIASLWAGSSATSTFVNTVTIAYGMRDMRGAVRSRLLALWLFIGTMLIGLVLLPLLVLGPSLLVELIPSGVRGDATSLLNTVYWPVLSLVLLAGLITFYHLAPPKRLPWHRGVPGALLAAAVFSLGGSVLRAYIGFIVGHGLSYGALAAPIAALLFFYVLALAVLLGAELNATIEQMWPSRPNRLTWRQRRRGRALLGSPTLASPTLDTLAGRHPERDTETEADPDRPVAASD